MTGRADDAAPETIVTAVSRAGLVGIAMLGLGAAIVVLAWGPFAMGDGVAPTGFAAIAASLVVVGVILFRRDIGKRLDVRSRLKVAIAAAIPALLTTAAWVMTFVLSQADVSAEAPRSTNASPGRIGDSTLAYAVNHLPKDTTGIAFLRVARLMQLNALPLDEPDFAALVGVVDQIRDCGIDPAKDLRFVLFAQRMHRLGKTGADDDAKNLFLFHGRFTREEFSACRTVLAPGAKVSWLQDELVAVATADGAHDYLDEVEQAGPTVMQNPLFAENLPDIGESTLAWGWMDTAAMQAAVPNEPLPKAITLTVALQDDALGLLLSTNFDDVRVAKAVEGQWLTNRGSLPAGALGRRFEYRREENRLTAEASVPLSEVSETASLVAFLLGRQ